ncbi:CAP-Gly domain-containing linker protein 2-like [Mercenaria mercenaria]|uniref:CAP-Gly domain-containing linker protein 2-like n=1 Tax=Mercenaria mercenaria TaxID=6596 RepID=UPI00234E84E6|nr:CAP-Gly domain-containing linker protein 2-like [Mercenaria mercenaria]
MVLFHNVNVGQKVEVNIGWGNIKGTVQYKGCLAGKQGEWVGVFLEERVGNCDGMVNGRRYFQCPNEFGLFVRANRIRFIPIQRCLYNKYHKKKNTSFVDEALFGNTPKPEVNNGPYDPIKISAKYHDKVTVGSSYDDNDIFRKNYHPLRHSISNTMPAATMKRPRSVTLTYTSKPVHGDYEIEEAYISSPSIPKTHMPYTALRRQVKRGWENSHYVREMSVPTGRESMKKWQWNDISV